MTNPFRKKTDPNEITQYISDIKEMMGLRDQAYNQGKASEVSQLTLNIEIAAKVLERLLERAG